MDMQPRIDGKKFDEGKPKMSFVARSLLVAIASIMEPGAVKYGRDNWRGGMLWSRPYDALLRHLTAWWEGDNLDAESGKSHLWHAACELMFLIEYEQKGLGQDDRFTAKAEYGKVAQVFFQDQETVLTIDQGFSQVQDTESVDA